MFFVRRIDAIVVNRGANIFSRSRLCGMQHKYATGCGQCNHCAARTIRHPDHVQFDTAVFEEQPDRRSETAAMPVAAKTALKRRETVNWNRSIQGAAKRTSYESGRGVASNIDGSIHRCNFSDRYALVICI